jgi:hypothetical protein
MKNRTVKKVERMVLVDKVCELQCKIDEYERFLGDLFIMLKRRMPQTVIKHECGDFAGLIWDETAKLINENSSLAAQNLQKDQP